MRPVAPILFLVTFMVGHTKALDVFESKAPKPVTVSTNGDGTLSFAPPTIPLDTLLVTGLVQKTSLPLLNSPSLAGDKAKCEVLVPAHSLPAHPDLTSLMLHYDNHGWLQGLGRGSQIVLRFKKNGEFDGVQLSASRIQPVGAANRSQPVGPQTNGTSAAAGSGR